MNKIILSQIFDISLEINGFTSRSETGGTTSIKEVIETFNSILKVLKLG